MGCQKDSRVSGLYKYLADSLRFLRIIKGLSQERVSEIALTSRKQYCACENGKAIPNLVTICILADLYDVPVDLLVSSKLAYTFVDPKTEK